MASVDGVSAFPNGDNLLSWTATISGPKGTVYDSLVYNLSLTFPADYPYSAPEVKVLALAADSIIHCHLVCHALLPPKRGSAHGHYMPRHSQGQVVGSL